MIKSAKLYFTDVGLAVYLLDIKEVGQVTRDPLADGQFENIAILEAMKTISFPYKHWDFNSKKEATPWITFLCDRILKRFLLVGNSGLIIVTNGYQR